MVRCETRDERSKSAIPDHHEPSRPRFARRRAAAVGAWLLAAASCGAAVLVASEARALDNGLARTPPMGWNSWNKFGCSGLNETVVKQMADAMVNSGLKGAGYQYVNLDDCWQSSRTSAGVIVADASKFPSGIQALADYVHAEGLKLGVYTDAGTATCQGRPGSYGHEAQDVATYASWGVDYVKVDWCNTAGEDPATEYGRFTTAFQEVAAAGKPMVFSICDWGDAAPWQWGPTTGNSWRTTGDIADAWSSMIGNAVSSSQHPLAAAPGAWNDPDMLEVGNGGMTPTEYQTHVSLWALMSAPLIAGNDLRSMSPQTKSLLTNPEVLAVDQDAAGRQGYKVHDWGNGIEVWAKPLKTPGQRAVVMLNRSSVASPNYVLLPDLGLVDPANEMVVRDLWARTNLGTFVFDYEQTVPAHGAVMLLVAPGTIGSDQGMPPGHLEIGIADSRPIVNLRLTVDFRVNGQPHHDWEDIAALDRTYELALNGMGGTWNGSEWVGNFLSTTGTVAGQGAILVNDVDSRAITDVRWTVRFTIAGQPYGDFEDVGDFVGDEALTLTGEGATWNGSEWVGNLLRPSLL